MPRNTIEFVLNDQSLAFSDIGADLSVLEFLRQDQRLTGTKEGCAEGDCGACTVLVGRCIAGTLKYEPVNACIRFLASLDGCHLVTIEHLRPAHGPLHPVQQAMVDFHGSQCGFCTPGIVMTLYALWMQSPNPSRAEVETALQGNLCRCTGYEPILKAAMGAGRYGAPNGDLLLAERQNILNKLSAMRDGQRVEVGPDDNRAILPANLDDLATLLVEHNNYTLVSGGTDVGLWVTKLLRSISPAIFLGHLDELHEIHDKDDEIILGAGVSYSESHAIITKYFSCLGPYWERIAGWQIRNMGTIGGNIANGSPIGDTLPVLIALAASVVLRRGDTYRKIALEDYFIDYGKQDIAPGEFVESIIIPKSKPTSLNAAYKVSKRRDEDIACVSVGISLQCDGNRISQCRIAYGGMAEIPKRAVSAEAMLKGTIWNETNFEAAAETLSQDFTPITDMRGSSDYRMLVAKNLVRRFFLDYEPANM